MSPLDTVLPPSRHTQIARIIDHHRHHLAENQNVSATVMSSVYDQGDGSTHWELEVHYHEKVLTKGESLDATFSLMALNERIAKEANLGAATPTGYYSMIAWLEDGLVGVIAWKEMP